MNKAQGTTVFDIFETLLQMIFGLIKDVVVFFYRKWKNEITVIPRSALKVKKQK